MTNSIDEIINERQKLREENRKLHEEIDRLKASLRIAEEFVRQPKQR